MVGLQALYSRQQAFGGILQNNIANIIPSSSSVNTSRGVFVLCGIISIAISLICFLKNDIWLPLLSSASKFVGASESLDLSHQISNDLLVKLLHVSPTSSVDYSSCLQELELGRQTVVRHSVPGMSDFLTGRQGSDCQKPCSSTGRAVCTGWQRTRRVAPEPAAHGHKPRLQDPTSYTCADSIPSQKLETSDSLSPVAKSMLSTFYCGLTMLNFYWDATQSLFNFVGDH